MKNLCLLVPSVALLLLNGRCLSEETTDFSEDPLKYAGPASLGDDLWLVNTRHVSNPTATDPGMQIFHAGDDQWIPSDVKSLAGAPTDGVRTVIYVHGYDFDEEKAERVGWAMYHALREQTPKAEKIRFITWSWPSTVIKYRLLRDVRDKGRRADTEAYFLAWLLSSVKTDLVVGSALGCRIVTGSLHLLAGDSPTLNTSISAKERQKRLRVALISPAIHDTCLLPGQFHGKAVSQVKTMLLLNNSLDPTLANYALIASKGSPIALGLSGIPSIEKLGEAAERIKQIEASDHIGEKHGVENYLRSTEIVRSLREILLADSGN